MKPKNLLFVALASASIAHAASPGDLAGFASEKSSAPNAPAVTAAPASSTASAPQATKAISALPSPPAVIRQAAPLAPLTAPASVVKPPAALKSSSSNKGGVENSVATVDELIKIDNAQARRKAREDASKTGMLDGNGGGSGMASTPYQNQNQMPAMPIGTPAVPLLSPPSPPNPPDEWVVKNIYGANGNIKTTIVLNGTPYYETTIGSTIKGCQITGITPKTVSFTPRPPAQVAAPADSTAKKIKAKSKLLTQSPKPVLPTCPTTVVWTGREQAEEYQNRSNNSNTLSAQQAPRPAVVVPALQPFQTQQR